MKGFRLVFGKSLLGTLAAVFITSPGLLALPCCCITS